MRVYLVIYVGNTEVLFRTGVKVDPEFWDSEKNHIKRGYKNRADLNLVISNCYSRLTDVLIRFRLQNRELIPTQIKDEYERPSLDYDALAFIKHEIDRREGELMNSTIRHHRAALSKLREYKNPITFAELTSEFFEDYNRYLKNHLKNLPNTRHGHIKAIRAYLNIAIRRGIIEHNPLVRMPVRRSHSDRVFLTIEERDKLVKIYDQGKLPLNYHRVLRHFLFSCYTGLRISDLRTITMDNIVGNTLVLIPVKSKNTTMKTVKIPLTKTAKRMIHDDSPFRVKGKVFDTYSEPRMRKYLKDIIVHAGIQKDINFHSARHTFATIFLSKTKNIAALQRILGHSNINQTMIYAHIVTDDLEREMKVFDS